MKKILILILAALMLSSAALAQVPSEMQIVNCEEWVSLRAQPDAASDRYAQVPLGETVRGFYGSHGQFSFCEYDGAAGYILNEYLQEDAAQGAVKLPSGDPALEISLGGGTIKAWYGFASGGEVLRLGFYTETDTLMWAYETQSLVSTELSSVSFFINDRAENPMVMVHNSSFGLIALDAYTGEEIWILPDGDVSLGGSITYAIADDGTMYIGGYYGPDPVAVSAQGKVLFRAAQDGDADFVWLDNIVILSDGVAAHYDNCGEPVWVGYDMNGKMISYDPDSAA